MKGVTSYKGISKYYFKILLEEIINLGDLKDKDCTILDFGCGEGRLKDMLGKKVIGFDIIKELSDVEDWRNVDFDVIVSNQVFYSFNEDALEKLLDEFKNLDRKITLIVGISNQSILNNIGKYLLGRKRAHDLTNLKPQEELNILMRHARLIKKKNVLGLSKIFLFNIN
tara:strand:- start:439 stop:945 length:507 start_codon:yes stop_codon:yes gene_type:complete